ncbi:MAG: sensor domain-containing diguanylate cyclase [Gammaproteobacteria bacterium]|nr:sensor domain-containing diguanylate cyclase [Gammaproteobacteria bacterium]MBU1554925.1 sensor domain-containing diguanylate cyclase [Gammaproteobacteria bacterium]MBU2068822.1 sensor domain-containing diguanylate cyclase [Gammaproteobacteria bacterium]MBU2184247.1 sensor domain-containing diguanylate cyclase [Gammaproteobacteria bacterium]MBU2206139.1 sensor domain-containing diguanylate cyclase [Gammaproteobacteria bacterium]
MTYLPDVNVTGLRHNWRTAQQALWFKLLLFFLLWLLSPGHSALAAPIDTAVFTDAMPGKYIAYFQEDNQRLSIEQALRHFASDNVKHGTSNAISLGIGTAPVWLRFSVSHTQEAAALYRLSVETPWLDHIDTWLVSKGNVIKQIRGGDAMPYQQRPMQYRFYAFEHAFEHGITEVYIRVESLGPMAIPVRLSRIDKAIQRDISAGYQYGVLWGIMSALALYNLVLFVFIRQKEYGLYACYLIGFVLNSLSYTGHIHTVITADFGPYFQDWTDITLMLTYSVAGLHFARFLLNTRSYAPTLDNIVKKVTLIIPAGMLLSFIFDQLVFAVVLVFMLNSGFVVLFIAMGVSALRAKKPFAVIFLLSSVTAAICITVSTLAVAGVLIPYNDYTFKAIEVGMAFEAILLAVILARQFRMAKLDKIIAESYARTDSLTGLNNRRGFYQITEPMWMTTLRENRDVSVVLLDIDAFKRINDSYGHACGDEVLLQVAQCIKATAREGDVPARWGGEEFIIFLPETTQSQALIQAERIRKALQNIQITTERFTITLTASLGVAGSEHGITEGRAIADITLEQLVNFADIALYSAKNSGKNRVCAVHDS